ncbi:MAG: 3-isopropylmalate dehydratase small subunit [Candidatus Poribacteria bacterium]|nr:3-isopropylmalate dehydratase small subunit [Candidatus Poribacteria bacterium]
MEPFVEHTGLAAPLDAANIDTDQIIPKQFLKRIERAGFGQFLFFDWRFKDDGSENPDFSLNEPQYRGASILIAGANFGCGSSREHAPWALLDYGFRVLIAPSFADIFRSNCYKNGILPIELSSEDAARLRRQAETRDGFQLTVNLPKQTVSDPDGKTYSFEMDSFRKEFLLKGLDDIGWTLQYERDIAEYEKKRDALPT